MEFVLLGHVSGDFSAQTDKMAEEKKNSIKYMILHCMSYTFVMGMIFFVMSRQVGMTLKMSVFVMLSHFMIDMLKQKLDKRTECEYIVFLVDQLLHILTLLFIVYNVNQQSCFQIGKEWMINNLNVDKYIIIVCAMLVCWKPAAIFVSLVFNIIPETIEQANRTESTSENKENEEVKIRSWENIENEEVKIGSWIGILEREIILILGIMGQFGAIGFVLTAKSLARYRQLEKKAFAEKYLVGTLLSAFIAIVCVAVVNKC